MVGAKGFEPSTPWSQTKCANQTALRPDKIKSVIIKKLCDFVKEKCGFLAKSLIISPPKRGERGLDEKFCEVIA